MAVCLACLCCCCKNIDKCKLATILCSFAACFTLCLSYLLMSEFTSWITSTWVSFLVSGVFILLVSCSVYFRVAAALFFIQLFSKFGLVMVYLTASWIAMQTSMGAYLRNHDRTRELLLEKNGIEMSLDKHWEIMLLEYIMGFLHYCLLLPFAALYIYSVMYEVTYEFRMDYRRGRRNPKKLDSKIEAMKTCLKFILGALNASSLLSFYFQRVGCQELQTTLESHGIDSGDLTLLPIGWPVGYVCVSAALYGLTYFSKKILFRHGIIRRHLRLQQEILRCKGDHIFIAKKSKKRVTLKQMKNVLKQKKSEKKAEKDEENHSDGEARGSSTEVKFENEKVTYKPRKHQEDNIGKSTESIESMCGGENNFSDRVSRVSADSYSMHSDISGGENYRSESRGRVRNAWD